VFALSGGDDYLLKGTVFEFLLLVVASNQLRFELLLAIIAPS
jgi:hypothetical protein